MGTNSRGRAAASCKGEGATETGRSSPAFHATCLLRLLALNGARDKLEK